MRSTAARKVDVEFGSCEPRELPALVARLDREFVFAKARQLSLSARFPNVLCADNTANILVARSGAGIVSTIASARFDWIANGSVWRGAMIGMVYTEPNWRGFGLASQLLSMTEARFAAEDVDFIVLWTNQQAFYAKLGWIPALSGYLCTLVAANRPKARPADSTGNIATRVAWIESLRQQWQSRRVSRTRASYQRLPIPAEALEIAVWDGGTRQGYAMLGRKGDTVILYEMIGHPDCFANLWSAVTRSGGPIIVNATCASPANKWLRCHTRANWELQRQAMWRPLSRRIEGVSFDEWHIPYFDRI